MKVNIVYACTRVFMKDFIFTQGFIDDFLTNALDATINIIYPICIVYLGLSNIKNLQNYKR